MKKGITIAFTYNLKPKVFDKEDPNAEFYAEFDTHETIDAIAAAIRASGYDVLMIEANEDAFDKFRAARKDIDLVFNFAEAVSKGRDREAHIPAMMEMLGIPYTGASPLSAALVLHKAKAKEIWAYNGIPTAPFRVLHSPNEKVKGIGFPMIVKPVAEGSSSGIRDKSVVRNEKELRAVVAETIRNFNEPALVEEFLDGREFTIGLIGNGDSLEAFPVAEVNFDSLPAGVNRIDGYEAKWLWEESSIDPLFCPARISKALERKIVSIAKAAFNAVECRDWARVDMRMDGKGNVYVLEINCPVGLIPDPKEFSRLPTVAKAAGLSFEQLVGNIISAALKRYGKK